MNLTSDVSLLIKSFSILTSWWSTPWRQHMCAAWATCYMTCHAFSLLSAVTVTPHEVNRFSQGEGHSRIMTKWSPWFCQSSSLMISGTLGLLFARIGRGDLLWKGVWIIRQKDRQFLWWLEGNFRNWDLARLGPVCFKNLNCLLININMRCFILRSLLCVFCLCDIFHDHLMN